MMGSTSNPVKVVSSSVVVGVGKKTLVEAVATGIDTAVVATTRSHHSHVEHTG